MQNMNHGSCTKSEFTVPSDRGKKQNTAACVITDEELHLWNTECVTFFFSIRNCRYDMLNVKCIVGQIQGICQISEFVTH